MDDVGVVDDEIDGGQIRRSARVGRLDLLEVPDADAEDRMVAGDLTGNRPDVRAATPSTRGEVEDARPNVRRRGEGEVGDSECGEHEQRREHVRSTASAEDHARRKRDHERDEPAS